MYQKPDFVKVSVKVNDVYATYHSECEHHTGMWTYWNPCEGTEDWKQAEYYHLDHEELFDHPCLQNNV